MKTSQESKNVKILNINTIKQMIEKLNLTISSQNWLAPYTLIRQRVKLNLMIAMPAHD